jgi:hypothetical protein
MKKLSLLFVLFVTILSFNCTPSKFIPEADQESIYSHDIDLPKAKIKEKLVLYVNEKFHSSKAVIQSNEDGLLSGNGFAQITTYVMHAINTEFTFIIKYQDNNYRTKWIIKDVLMNANSIAQNYWGYYLESKEIKDFFKKHDDDMFAYISKNEVDF